MTSKLNPYASKRNLFEFKLLLSGKHFCYIKVKG